MDKPHQLDLMRHSDEALARANREAAEAALVNPYFTPDLARQRAEYYRSEAAKYEASPRQS